MSFTLWISKTTGTRRKGTRAREVREVLSSRITAAALMEALMSCPSTESAVDMKHTLGEHAFDVAGVQESENGPVVGFVEAKSLVSGTVSEHIQKITAENLISDSASLIDVLDVLSRRDWTFVLTGSAVNHILTRADLGKPIARAYYSTLVSLLEMHLTYWVDSDYPRESWVAKLKEDRVTRARKLFDDHNKRGTGTKLVSCLQFCDKRDLFLERHGGLGNFGLDTTAAATCLLRKAEKVRDSLAHGQAAIAGGMGWDELAKLFREVGAFLEKSDLLAESDRSNAVSA